MRRAELAVLLLLGLGAAAGLPGFGLWPLSLPALALALRRIATVDGARGAMLAAGVFGLGWFGLGLSWIVHPFFVEPLRHGWMAPFALAGLASGMALFWALGAGAGWLIVRRPGGRLALAVALGMAAAELVRSRILGGFPWNGPGLVWAPTPIAQLGALFGPYGLSAGTLLLAALPVAAAAAGPRRRIAALVMVALALAAAWVWGSARLARPSEEGQRPVLRIVQPNAVQRLKWDPEAAVGFFRRALALTGAGRAAELVVWPETAVPWLYDPRGDAFRAIVEAARGAPVILGVQRAEGGRYFNSLVILGRQGELARYDKFHLVPFGEYVPLGDLAARFGLSGLAQREGAGYTPGPGPRVLDVPGIGRIQPLICYEAIFPRHIRNAPMRPEVLVQITNDAWFGTGAGPRQHLAQARMRAIEFGLPLVRAANTGISAVVDARGRLRAELGMGRAGRLDVALPVALPPTPYARLGEAPVALLLVIWGLGLLVVGRSR